MDKSGLELKRLPWPDSLVLRLNAFATIPNPFFQSCKVLCLCDCTICILWSQWPEDARFPWNCSYRGCELWNWTWVLWEGSQCYCWAILHPSSLLWNQDSYIFFLRDSSHHPTPPKQKHDYFGLSLNRLWFKLWQPFGCRSIKGLRSHNYFILLFVLRYCVSQDDLNCAWDRVQSFVPA